MLQVPQREPREDHSMADPVPGTDEKQDPFVLTASPHFAAWLARAGAGIAFSTYQAGKLFLLGLQDDGRLAVFERTMERCMGIAVSADARSFVLATLYQLHRFDNVVPPGGRHGVHDAVYVPHRSWITGGLDVHDVGLLPDGDPAFVATLFSCLATVSGHHSFRPLWQPRFVSRLAPEDRCHLNGMAMDRGKPAYVTAVGRSDVADGWRDQRVSGGVLIDVKTSEIVAQGLSMPHSPRMHGGKVWLLNSGAGEFGYVEPERGTFEPVAFCPGYARGLSIVDGHAVVGLSLPRENRTFAGLPLEDNLRSRGATARCGLLVIDLATGNTVEWVRIEGVVRELYDVAVLPGVRRPSAIGFKSDEIRRMISIES
jgi:uncharacterized protein (TIGR03032 family)